MVVDCVVTNVDKQSDVKGDDSTFLITNIGIVDLTMNCTKF